jgi:hypothetical protein
MTTITTQHSPKPKLPAWIVALAVALIFLPILSACGQNHVNPIPAPPPPIVKVAVPVPCEVATVAEPVRPAAQARADDDIFTLVKVLLADRKVVEGEAKELRTVNEAACK